MVPAMIPALLLTMTLTIYVPHAGRINGPGTMADGTRPQMGHVACGPRYPFGTIFEVMLDEMPYGLPRVFECRDRGGMVGNKHLDMVLCSDDVRRDLTNARSWGKRRVPVRVWKSWGDYQAMLPLPVPVMPAPEEGDVETSNWRGTAAVAL